jgi:hypothetical protein
MLYIGDECRFRPFQNFNKTEGSRPFSYVKKKRKEGEVMDYISFLERGTTHG